MATLNPTLQSNVDFAQPVARPAAPNLSPPGAGLSAAGAVIGLLGMTGGRKAAPQPTQADRDNQALTAFSESLNSIYNSDLTDGQKQRKAREAGRQYLRANPGHRSEVEGLMGNVGIELPTTFNTTEDTQKSNISEWVTNTPIGRDAVVKALAVAKPDTPEYYEELNRLYVVDQAQQANLEKLKRENEIASADKERKKDVTDNALRSLVQDWTKDTNDILAGGVVSIGMAESDTALDQITRLTELERTQRLKFERQAQYIKANPEEYKQYVEAGLAPITGALNMIKQNEETMTAYVETYKAAGKFQYLKEFERVFGGLAHMDNADVVFGPIIRDYARANMDPENMKKLFNFMGEALETPAAKGEDLTPGETVKPPVDNQEKVNSKDAFGIIQGAAKSCASNPLACAQVIKVNSAVEQLVPSSLLGSSSVRGYGRGSTKVGSQIFSSKNVIAFRNAVADKNNPDGASIKNELYEFTDGEINKRINKLYSKASGFGVDIKLGYDGTGNLVVQYTPQENSNPRRPGTRVDTTPRILTMDQLDEIKVFGPGEANTIRGWIKDIRFLQTSMAEIDPEYKTTRNIQELDIKSDTMTSGGGDTQVQGSELNDTLQTGAKPLIFDLVDRYEGAGDYDTLFGHSQKSGEAFAGVKVSEMSIGEAIAFANGEYAQWATDKLGYKATPMGRYQFVGTTLAQVAKEMGLPMNLKFSKQTQDAMFMYWAKKHAGSVESLRGQWEGFKRADPAVLEAARQELLTGELPNYVGLQTEGNMVTAPLSSMRPEGRPEDYNFETAPMAEAAPETSVRPQARPEGTQEANSGGGGGTQPNMEEAAQRGSQRVSGATATIRDIQARAAAKLLEQGFTQEEVDELFA